MTAIEPELLHLNEEIVLLSKELNVISLQNDVVNVKDNFLRLISEIREKFDRFDGCLSSVDRAGFSRLATEVPRVWRMTSSVIW